MARAKLKFRLHRAVIVLFCLTLLVALMQGASWFSQNHQRQRNPQLEELARTLARQVTLNIAPLMRSETPDENRINAVLRQLTQESRILDAGVYDEQGDLLLALAKASMCATGWRWMAKKRAAILTNKLSSLSRGKTAHWATCV
ncbi:membrane protein [Salmonella enterica subsp. enterica serovar Madelia]|nr:membrane protein [Salmonella enterica subsp. enterica serovar Madelia]